MSSYLLSGTESGDRGGRRDSSSSLSDHQLPPPVHRPGPARLCSALLLMLRQTSYWPTTFKMEEAVCHITTETSGFLGDHIDIQTQLNIQECFYADNTHLYPREENNVHHVLFWLTSWNVLLLTDNKSESKAARYEQNQWVGRDIAAVLQDFIMMQNIFTRISSCFKMWIFDFFFFYLI